MNKKYVLALVIVVLTGLLCSCGFNKKTFDWSSSPLAQKLPEPPSNKGEIYDNLLSAHVDDVSAEEYSEYVDKCKEAGFTVEAEEESDKYEAFDSEGYKLSLSYWNSNSKLDIDLDEPTEMSDINWPGTGVATLIPEPKSLYGSISYEHENSFNVLIGNTTKDDYAEYVEACSNAGFTVDYDKGDTWYYAYNDDNVYLALNYEGNNVMRISIEEKESTKEDIEDTGDEDSYNTDDDSDYEEAEADEDEDDEDDSDDADSGKVSSKFKKVMDAYEKFVNKYVKITKKYTKDPMKYMDEYTDAMNEYYERLEEIEDIDTDDLSAADLAYYYEVLERVNKKISKLLQ